MSRVFFCDRCDLAFACRRIGLRGPGGPGTCTRCDGNGGTSAKFTLTNTARGVALSFVRGQKHHPIYLPMQRG
jgi:hypothetical protein